MVRLSLAPFTPVLTAEDCRKEQAVGFTVQCITLPASDDDAAHSDAIDLADAMAWTIFEALQGDTLGGQASAVVTQR